MVNDMKKLFIFAIVAVLCMTFAFSVAAENKPAYKTLNIFLFCINKAIYAIFKTTFRDEDIGKTVFFKFFKHFFHCILSIL